MWGLWCSIKTFFPLTLTVASASALSPHYLPFRVLCQLRKFLSRKKDSLKRFASYSQKKEKLLPPSKANYNGKSEQRHIFVKPQWKKCVWWQTTIQRQETTHKSQLFQHNKFAWKINNGRRKSYFEVWIHFWGIKRERQRERKSLRAIFPSID